MSHLQQRDFIGSLKEKHPDFFEKKRVLEVGSLNINGTIRDFFKDCDYTGLDLGEGECVDVVCGGHEYKEPNNSYDVCASCECFEHNPYWLETFKNMIRLCKPNGLIFMTCATTGRPEHGTRKSDAWAAPLCLDFDYYKNLTEKDFRESMDLDKLFSRYEFKVNTEVIKDLYFCGFKK